MNDSVKKKNNAEKGDLEENATTGILIFFF